MKTIITFRHLEPTQSLKDHVEDKISKLDKLVKETSEAYIVLSTERYLHVAEIKLPLKGSTVTVSEKSADMYQSIDGAIEKARKNLEKIREKKRSKKTKLSKVELTS